MMAKRTALLGMLICLTAFAAIAQPVTPPIIAPNARGDIGLFTMSTADNPRAGQFTLGFYGWYFPRIAGQLVAGQPTDTRYFVNYGGNASMGLGLTDWWSIFVAGGGQVTKSGGGWAGGVINGVPIAGPFQVSEGTKVRVGTKFNYHSEVDYDFRIAGWLSANIPVGNATVNNETTGELVQSLNTRRTDWEWGAAVTKSIFTGLVSYQLTGQPSDSDVRVPNLLRFGFGVEVPVAPLIHILGEVNYNVLDGGDVPEPDYATMIGGARIWFGHTGWALTAGFSTNMTMLFSNGTSQNPFGGLIGITYAAWPPAPPPPVIVPAPEPVVEQRVVETAPAPAPAQQPPPRPAPRTTSDEIFFDGKSARLTNIAKAVLDGVALRMRNDLNATAVVTGFTDNTGSEQANIDLGVKRAQAAKEYLVTRHGIDPGRISTMSKGAADPGYDNATAEGRTKNRRAQIVVTLISGT
jgi:outer membrane protein OmpA-like peptidoglycan-associated protein